MTVYDPELTDEEWRTENFPSDVIFSAARMGHVASASKLIAYAETHGVDGILESAIMLGQDDYKRVEAACKKLPQLAIKRRGPRKARTV